VSQPSQPPLLLRPTLDTKFHIDYEWWRRANRDVEVFLRDYLCPEHQQVVASGEEELAFDFVDPDTAEVRRIGGLQQVLHPVRHADQRLQAEGHAGGARRGVRADEAEPQPQADSHAEHHRPEAGDP